jgi:hypothetical protein
MPHYFCNNSAQSDGNHEVHQVGCKLMPSDKRYLGNYFSLSEARIEARKDFWQADVCGRCAKADGMESRAMRVERFLPGATGRF